MQMIATDNLDLGCTIFEKAATEKAIREIDERLVQQYNNRTKAKGSNQPFFDQSQLHGRFPMHLPDSLKPKPGHLNPAQQRVYEDFACIPPCCGWLIMSWSSCCCWRRQANGLHREGEQALPAPCNLGTCSQCAVAYHGSRVC